MPYRALTSVMLGHAAPPAQPGELIPATFLDMEGHERPVDFDRLVEAGAAKKVDEPKRAKP